MVRCRRASVIDWRERVSDVYDVAWRYPRFFQMMHSTRQVLRPTQNRPQSRDAPLDSQKTKSFTSTLWQQQENAVPSSLTKKLQVSSRPILTAIRSVRRRHAKDNQDESHMLVSPSVKATLLAEIERPSCTNEKTREELEQELIEL